MMTMELGFSQTQFPPSPVGPPVSTFQTGADFQELPISIIRYFVKDTLLKIINEINTREYEEISFSLIPLGELPDECGYDCATKPIFQSDMNLDKPNDRFIHFGIRLKLGLRDIKYFLSSDVAIPVPDRDLFLSIDFEFRCQNWEVLDSGKLVIIPKVEIKLEEDHAWWQEMNPLHQAFHETINSKIKKQINNFPINLGVIDDLTSVYPLIDPNCNCLGVSANNGPEYDVIFWAKKSKNPLRQADVSIKLAKVTRFLKSDYPASKNTVNIFINGIAVDIFKLELQPGEEVSFENKIYHSFYLDEPFDFQIILNNHFERALGYNASGPNSYVWKNYSNIKKVDSEILTKRKKTLQTAGDNDISNKPIVAFWNDFQFTFQMQELKTEKNNRHPDSSSQKTVEDKIKNQALTFGETSLFESNTARSDSLQIHSTNSFSKRIIKTEKILDYSEKQGTVVLEICLDSLGAVISADYQEMGSTTTDEYLINLAKENIGLWEFSAALLEKECGTITFRFMLQ